MAAKMLELAALKASIPTGTNIWGKTNGEAATRKRKSPPITPAKLIKNSLRQEYVPDLVNPQTLSEPLINPPSIVKATPEITYNALLNEQSFESESYSAPAIDPLNLILEAYDNLIVPSLIASLSAAANITSSSASSTPPPPTSTTTEAPSSNDAIKRWFSRRLFAEIAKKEILNKKILPGNLTSAEELTQLFITICYKAGLLLI